MRVCKHDVSLHECVFFFVAPQRFVLLSSRDRIQRLLLDDVSSPQQQQQQAPDINLPVTNVRSIRAMTFDPSSDMVYWLEARGVLRKARAQDGSQVRGGGTTSSVCF